MANYNDLKASIQEVIRTNGNNEITGALLQQTLLAIVNALGDGYQYAWRAVPATNPGTPDQKVFYLAGPGVYPNFNNATVNDGEIGIFKYNGSWTIEKISVGKNYDGYLGIEYGSILNASSTVTGKQIGLNGSIVDNEFFILKTYTVQSGKSYYITGLEAGNQYSSGWAVYKGASQLANGATNISTNDAVVRIPDGGNTLYVCQPNYLNLPEITVRETTSVVADLYKMLERIEDVVGVEIVKIDNLDVANYALLVDTYVNKYWENGKLSDDPMQVRNATSLVEIDKTKDIIPGTNGWADIVFFGGNKNYLSTSQAYISSPIDKSKIPSDAVYMAFNYYRNSCVALDSNFYVSTRPYQNRLTMKLYASHNKVKGTRPKINIYLDDSQEDIFKKLVDAIYIEDCDVVFEKGAYTLNSIFYLMQSKYQWADAFELPIGGNCHYYLNNSTITGNYAGQTPSSGSVVEKNSSIFGTHRLDGQTFELHDGELIANGLVYCVHDEASGGNGSYVHHYENMIMKYNTGQYTQSLSKCIGGGTGLAGEVVLNGCKFFNAHTSKDISWHGHTLTTASVFKLFVANSFFDKGIGLDQMAENETGYLFLSASLVPSVPSQERWTVFSAI